MTETLGSHQNQGKRPYQEDRCIHDQMIIDGTRMILLAVADGMGGHKAGDIAAEFAIQEVKSFFSKLNSTNLETVKKALAQAFYRINLQIEEYTLEHEDARGMGTTLTCAVILNNKMIIGHIGDSRAYIVNEDGIHRCTKDHTAQQEAIESGIDIRRINVGANALTRCLDGSENEKPDISNLFDVNNSLVFVCSDGVHGSLTDSQLEIIAKSSTDAFIFAKSAVRSALLNGASDNVTIAAMASPDRKLLHDGSTTTKQKKGLFRRFILNLALVLLIIAGLGLTVYGSYLFFYSEESDAISMNNNFSESDSLLAFNDVNVISSEFQKDGVRDELNIVDHRGLSEQFAEIEAPPITQLITKQDLMSNQDTLQQRKIEEYHTAAVQTKAEIQSEDITNNVNNDDRFTESNKTITADGMIAELGVEDDLKEAENQKENVLNDADTIEIQVDATNTDLLGVVDKGIELFERERLNRHAPNPGFYLVLSENSGKERAENDMNRLSEDMDRQLILFEDTNWKVIFGPFITKEAAEAEMNKLTEKFDSLNISVIKIDQY